LIDWLYALNYDDQLTKINWYYNHYGPFVHDVYDIASNSDKFNSKPTSNLYGSNKYLITLSDGNYEPSLSSIEKEIADIVIDKTKNLYWDGFMSLVYSTYPIIYNERYNYLDLKKMAKEAKSRSDI
jgi:hypothetical protein